MGCVRSPLLMPSQPYFCIIASRPGKRSSLTRQVGRSFSFERFELPPSMGSCELATSFMRPSLVTRRWNNAAARLVRK